MAYAAKGATPAAFAAGVFAAGFVTGAIFGPCPSRRAREWL